MLGRFGLGPVFVYEWLATSRRWQHYAGRSLFVALLLAAFLLVWLSEALRQEYWNLQTLAWAGERFFYGIIGTQLVLVLLAAPAAAAGTICLDKERGTLFHLFVTDLSNAEIVLGKLATRLLAVFSLVLCALPVLFLTTLVGGVDSGALLGAFLITLGLALLGGTLALFLSVWCSKTYEVLLTTYLIWALVLLIRPVWHYRGTPVPPWWLDRIDPFWLAFAPYTSPGTTGLGDDLAFLAACSGLSIVLAALAIARIRAVAVRQSSRPARGARRFWQWFDLGRVRRWIPGPSLDWNPVLWREWYRRRPSRWARSAWLFYALLAALFTLLTIREELAMTPGFDLGPFVNAFQVSIGLLLVGVGSVSSLTEERTRGTMDVLLSTPLVTYSILWGKWWGTYRIVLRLTILPCAIMAVLGVAYERWEGVPLMALVILSCGAAVTSLGLALATWIARPGRAIALCMIAYVVIAAGPIIVTLLFRWAGSIDAYMISASPWYGAGVLTAYVKEGPPIRTEIYGWIVFWAAAYTVVAVGLYLATLATFNQRLGRITGFPFVIRCPPREIVDLLAESEQQAAANACR